MDDNELATSLSNNGHPTQTTTYPDTVHAHHKPQIPLSEPLAYPNSKVALLHAMCNIKVCWVFLPSNRHNACCVPLPSNGHDALDHHAYYGPSRAQCPTRPPCPTMALSGFHPMGATMPLWPPFHPMGTMPNVSTMPPPILQVQHFNIQPSG